MKKLYDYFSPFERIMWCVSVIFIVGSYIIFGALNHITLVASIIGVTSLVLNAKGNPVGQLLMVIFSLIYGYIAYTFSYYGEMITYLGMTAPMAVAALVAWVRNPHKGNRAEVEIKSINFQATMVMLILSVLVTAVFYFVLKYFNTNALALSTLSVTTSFIAVYLTFRRSSWFAAAYAANDVVLIILWILASVEDVRYLSVVICFAVFLVNDLYGFVNWRKIQQRQMSEI